MTGENTKLPSLTNIVYFYLYLHRKIWTINCKKALDECLDLNFLLSSLISLDYFIGEIQRYFIYAFSKMGCFLFSLLCTGKCIAVGQQWPCMSMLVMYSQSCVHDKVI